MIGRLAEGELLLALAMGNRVCKEENKAERKNKMIKKKKKQAPTEDDGGALLVGEQLREREEGWPGKAVLWWSVSGLVQQGATAPADRQFPQRKRAEGKKKGQKVTAK